MKPKHKLDLGKDKITFYLFLISDCDIKLGSLLTLELYKISASHFSSEFKKFAVADSTK